MATGSKRMVAGQPDRLAEEFLQLSRLALAGRQQDVGMLLRRSVNRLGADHPDVAEGIRDLLARSTDLATVVRRSPILAPEAEDVVGDRLVRIEYPTVEDCRMILGADVLGDLAQIVAEYRNRDRLAQAGLSPSQAVLMTGPPGVGKTLASRRIAAELGVALVVLDLSAVMSSMLGRTGANIREVMDYAKSQKCVLLLDEIDAVAKRRNDNLDIGELKRLVTVLLQQLDVWPAEAGLVVGTTNHPELLDPAAWRRFDTVIEFALPSEKERAEAVAMYLNSDLPSEVLHLVAVASDGMSFSDLERLASGARRRSALSENDLATSLLEGIRRLIVVRPLTERRSIGVQLSTRKLASQRQIHSLTGLSRDTLRRHTGGD